MIMKATNSQDMQDESSWQAGYLGNPIFSSSQSHKAQESVESVERMV